MTDQEIKDLARKYAEENPPQTVDEKLKEFGMFLNATEVFEPFLYWLLRDHCIISHEKVKEVYDKYEKNFNDHADSYFAGGTRAIEDLFDSDLFQKGGEK